MGKLQTLPPLTLVHLSSGSKGNELNRFWPSEYYLHQLLVLRIAHLGEQLEQHP